MQSLVDPAETALRPQEWLERFERTLADLGAAPSEVEYLSGLITTDPVVVATAFLPNACPFCLARMLWQAAGTSEEEAA